MVICLFVDNIKNGVGKIVSHFADIVERKIIVGFCLHIIPRTPVVEDAVGINPHTVKRLVVILVCLVVKL